MAAASASSAPSVYPTLRYTDAPAAIEFLVRAFGMTRETVLENPDGSIAHAELGWGNGIVMLGSRRDDMGIFEPGRAVLYLAVDDPDAHHARAAGAGAEIVMPLTDQDYGSREYAARDPEGNVWTFGTYRPVPKGKDVTS
jgi:uncharacterized glyoxalase superfamily protein PhnB